MFFSDWAGRVIHVWDSSSCDMYTLYRFHPRSFKMSARVQNVRLVVACCSVRSAAPSGCPGTRARSRAVRRVQRSAPRCPAAPCCQAGSHQVPRDRRRVGWATPVCRTPLRQSSPPRCARRWSGSCEPTSSGASARQTTGASFWAWGRKKMGRGFCRVQNSFCYFKTSKAETILK